jgi:hypothetical protein
MKAMHDSNGSNRLVRGVVSGILALSAFHAAALAQGQAVATSDADAAKLPAAGHDDAGVPTLTEVVVTG